MVAASTTMIWSRRSVVKMRLNVVIACPGRRDECLDRPVASTERRGGNSVIAPWAVAPAAGRFTAAQTVNGQAASGAAWSVREAK
jgi:hypothetical protein